MNRVIKLALALLLALGTTAAAQVKVGDNINVLPVYKSTPAGQEAGPDDYLRGDLYGQRQNEPSIAVSTVNRDHIVAFFNDFRAVNQPADKPLPDARTSTVASRILSGVQQFFARLVGRPAPGGPAGRGAEASPKLLATGGEAWIGMSVSYDGGTTWVGGVMPGHQDDLTKASVTSPAFFGTPSSPIPHGGSDPVVASAPCGRFYVAFMSFVRGGESRLIVARFQDMNDSDQRHTIKYLGAAQVGVAMNATNGQFVDKPHMVVEPTGAGACDATTVTENVYVSYTTFVGGAQNKFTSKINVASSFNGGKSFSVTKVDDSYTQSQGTSLVSSPANKDLFLFWRSFTVPNSVIYSRKTPKGAWSKPVDLLTLTGGNPMAPFDQQSVSTTFPGDTGQSLAPRSNGFPGAAITPDGKFILVVWQERVTAAGAPNLAEQPRIVLMQYDVAANRWSGRRVVAPFADTANTPYGLGFFRGTAAQAGPQLMPAIACAAGNQCVVTYYESRYLTNPTSGGWVAGFDNVVDLRGAVVTPASSGPQFSASFQVSRYGYQPPAVWDETTINQFIADASDGTLDADPLTHATQIQPPWGGADAYASLNYSGYPHTGGGTTPFMGDYNDIRSTAPFVLKNGAWVVPTNPADVPAGGGFVAAWTDNRYLIRPGGNDFEAYSFPVELPDGTYTPCTNPGSRDQSVLTSQIGLGLLLTTSTNYKPIPADKRMTFPVTIWNNTAQDKVFTIGLSTPDLAAGGTAKASFGKQEDAPVAGFPYPLVEGERVVFAYSSSSFYVYVNDTGKLTPGGSLIPSPVTVSAVEKCASVTYDPVSGAQTTCTAPAGTAMSASLTLNSDASRAAALTPTFSYTSPAVVANPVPKNPVPKNPVPKNPVPKNPVPKNSVTGEPVTVYDVIDYTVNIDVPPGADPADVSSYLGLFNVDKAYQDAYIFQIFVSKPTYAYEVLDLDNCGVGNGSSGVLVGHVSDPSNPVPKNPVPKNPVPKNPVPKNASLSDAIVQNSTFTLGTGDGTTSSGGTAAATSGSTTLGCDPTTGAGLIAECTKAAPRTPNQVSITLRAYQIAENPPRPYQPHDDGGSTGAPPALFVANANCTSGDPSCIFTDGPDLAVGVTTAGVAPAEQKAGLPISFPVPDPVLVTNISADRSARAHKIGYYISAATRESELPRNADGTIRECPGTAGCGAGDRYTRLLTTTDQLAVLPGGTESITTESLTIPSDIPRPNADGTGFYYIWAYVDSDRVVSELDEDNNLVQGGVLVDGTLGPIKVTAPGYGFIGLQSPCNFGILGDASTANDPSCTRNGGGAVPIAWQFSNGGSTAVDSASLVKDGPGDTSYFNLKFFRSGVEPVNSPYNAATNPNGYMAVAQPDPTSITTGSSGFQYFTTGTASRPAFSWQFNWNRPNPPFAVPGCYDMWIEIPPVQVIGGGEGNTLPALGPIKICLN